MKLYYVYYAIDKNGESKVGCTSQPKIRKLRYLEFILLESFTCAIQAGDREIELQQKYFGKRDGSTHYAEMIKKQPIYDDEYRKKTSEWSKKYWTNKRIKERTNQISGVNNYKSKFTEKDVKYIRKKYHKLNHQKHTIPNGKLSGKDLAEKFNVDYTTIMNIINRKSYKNI